MVDSLHIKGFKSFVDYNFQLNNLNIFTGLNSCGKSTVIQALRILDRVNRGEKEPLLPGHGGKVELQNIHVAEPFSIVSEFGDEDSGEKGKIKFLANEPCIQNGIEFPHVIYISAGRYGPQTSIPISSGIEIGPRGENVLHCLDALGDEVLDESLRHEKSEGYTLGYNLKAWLNAITPGVEFDYKIVDKTDSSYTLFDEHRSSNVGFGLSYTLPIIVAALASTIHKNNLVLIENPEAHLHPKGQTELARLICLCAQVGTQFVIETHSDHFFDGVRIFCKKNKGFAEHVNPYWLELDENRCTKVLSPHIDDNGRLDKWPEGMFDQFEVNAEELL